MESNKSFIEKYSNIIHIVSEVVIISGVSFYFITRIKKLENTVENLKIKVNQQQEVIDNILNLLKDKNINDGYKQVIETNYIPDNNSVVSFNKELDNEILEELKELEETKNVIVNSEEGSEEDSKEIIVNSEEDSKDVIISSEEDSKDVIISSEEEKNNM